MEPEDAKELIDAAVERAELAGEAERSSERLEEKRFRDRVSVLVGLFAVLLAIVHMAAASTARDSVLRTVEASDTFNYMQAKIIRETVLKSAAANGGSRSAAMADEAARLRGPDRAGHGIGQLRATGDALRRAGEEVARRGERYELAETALQLAIVLLSIALVARSRPIVAGSVLLASVGAGVSAATALGII